jgi:hypothetical protein
MAQISIKTDVDKLKLDLDKVRRAQVPYATRLTVNKLAEVAKLRMEVKELPKLDRPTRYTLGMMRVNYANRSNLKSQVLVKDSATVTKRGMHGPAAVLGHLFDGGQQRKGKGFEGLLVSRGIMPKGMYAVPGQGIKLDQYGNIPKPLLIQILSYLQAFDERGFKANVTADSRGRFEKRVGKKSFGGGTVQFFVAKKGDKNKLHPGIWARVALAQGTSLKPMIMFVNETDGYKKYFDLDSIVKEVVDRDLRFEFNKAMEIAMATAK